MKEILKYLPNSDFLLLIGDGKEDEALFSALSEDWQHTVTVGRKRSEAKTYVDNVKEVEDLLFKLATQH